MRAGSKALRRLRGHAIGATLGPPLPLADAVARLGFVQYDPIRRPARAQDVILFQRVAGYRAGDLDRHYPSSDLEEDHLHAYGALRPEVAALLHPRPDRDDPGRPYRPRGLTAEVLAHVRAEGSGHPRDVAAALGRRPAANDWGGVSAATTQALTELHYHGLLRVARRDRGVKVYEPATVPPSPLTPRERLRGLAMAILRVLAPVAESGLKRAVGQLCAHSGGLEGRRDVVGELAAADAVTVEEVDGVRYLSPARPAAAPPEGAGEVVRFLAPFDPLVWDRGRFEHLWGWSYRFEAYTPRRRRRFGYYAMPMLWRDRVIGWANLERTPSGRLDVDHGFAGAALSGRAFRRAFAREVDRFETMLAPRASQGAASAPEPRDANRTVA